MVNKRAFIRAAEYYHYPTSITAACDLDVDAALEQLDRIKHDVQLFWQSSIGQACFKRIRTLIIRFWKSNVYTYFRARNNYECSRQQTHQRARPQMTGNLGKACDVTLSSNGEIQVRMRKMYHTWIYKDGSARTWEYSRFLRFGTAASPGKYDPDYDCRLNTGMHPGVSTAKHWDPWFAKLRDFVRQTIVDQVSRALPRYVKAVCKGSVTYKTDLGPVKQPMLWKGAGVNMPWLT